MGIFPNTYTVRPDIRVRKGLRQGKYLGFKKMEYEHIWVFACVYIAVWNQVIANIPVMKGLLTACKRSLIASIAFSCSCFNIT